MSQHSTSVASRPVSAAEFRALYDEVSTWARGDKRGALHHLDRSRVVAAAGLVHSGVTVSLALPLDTEPGLANPQPADHHMTLLPDEDIGLGTVRFAKDYIGVDFHNDGCSHVDALSHVVFDGCLYGGPPAESVTAGGANEGSIEVLRNGLVGRGVLLDLPGLRAVEWLEPGEHVLPDELEAAEVRQGIRVGNGDILFVRTGHARRLAELPAWDTTRAKAGLHPTAVRFLAQRGVAALGSDTNSDAAPSTTEGIGFPIHVLAVNAMGVHLLDYLQFEGLLAACRAAGRWEFLIVVAPLRIVGGTGSPVNPIAIL